MAEVDAGLGIPPEVSQDIEGGGAGRQPHRLERKWTFWFDNQSKVKPGARRGTLSPQHLHLRHRRGFGDFETQANKGRGVGIVVEGIESPHCVTSIRFGLTWDMVAKSKQK
ncbi:hypothetical protein HPP92_022501 [Vanilla planifolia]|uniref:Uncharacterized protein n=1 Tax=Vanilla planifolia TaxID=51239 RepID=A0A835UBZ7_VANPL|nr:hypothetical protein HPP92_022501 [Vanilla planifolia]